MDEKSGEGGGRGEEGGGAADDERERLVGGVDGGCGRGGGVGRLSQPAKAL